MLSDNESTAASIDSSNPKKQTAWSRVVQVMLQQPIGEWADTPHLLKQALGDSHRAGGPSLWNKVQDILMSEHGLHVQTKKTPHRNSHSRRVVRHGVTTEPGPFRLDSGDDDDDVTLIPDPVTNALKEDVAKLQERRDMLQTQLKVKRQQIELLKKRQAVRKEVEAYEQELAELMKLAAHESEKTNTR